MSRFKFLALFIIIITAFLLRFYKLDSYPALNADEAAIGYNVYSLLQTGKDEHGNSWPIHFQSFNDYKPGFYFYVALPFIKFLGLNELAVRIPGALSGVGTVVVIYFLVNELFTELKRERKEFLAIASALFLAISPWHIHFSRGAWEVNVATFLITFGLLMLLKSINRGLVLKPLIISVVLFVAAMYTYHSVRVVAPLLVFGVFVLNFKIIVKKYKNLAIAAVIGILLLAPLVRDFTRPAITSRAAGVGLFADPGPISRAEEQRSEHPDFSSKAAKLIHNKGVNYGLVFVQNWSEHYWGEFLFLSGDEIQRSRVPETGQMYTVEAIFLVVALVSIIRLANKRLQTQWQIILWWLLIAPSAAALTFQSPHALRAQNMVVPLTIISAYGLTVIVETIKNFVKNKHVKFTLYSCLGAVIILSVGRYVHMYYSHMSKEYPFSSQYGVKELVNYLSENTGKYQKVLITDRYDQPYILFLFYSKYDPATFQKEHTLTGRDNYGFSTVGHFSKYYFTSIKYDEVQPQNPNSIIVGAKGEIPKEANIVKNIYGSNGYLYFQVVAN